LQASLLAHEVESECWRVILAHIVIGRGWWLLLNFHHLGKGCMPTLVLLCRKGLEAAAKGTAGRLTAWWLRDRCCCRCMCTAAVNQIGLWVVAREPVGNSWKSFSNLRPYTSHVCGRKAQMHLMHLVASGNCKTFL
jgi:hypothetical protein